jgi:hypothetical protein
MAGKYGSGSITITYDDGPGGTGRVVTGHIEDMSGAKITSVMQATAAFGDTWDEHTPVGRKRMEQITLKGKWDTTATTGPHVVFLDPDDGPQDSTRTLVLVFGDSKTLTVETYLVSYEVRGVNGSLTEFEAVIQPTGTATWS